MTRVTISTYSPAQAVAIRSILERIGWAEQYIASAERNAQAFSERPDVCAVYLAHADDLPVGFIYLELHEWNRLAQIHGLAVDPGYQRRGVARELVQHGEDFAKKKGARGMYVDTPARNMGGRAFYEAMGYRFGYEMPRYYEDNLDGVTYQKFF